MVMAQTRSSTMGANSALARQNALLQQQQRILRARAMVAGGVAFGGALIIGAGLKQAGDFQQAMTGVAIATGQAGSQMDRFNLLALRMSNVTAQSVTTIAQEMAAAATAGLNIPSRLYAAFPQIARAADVMWLSPKHLDPVQSVTQMATMAHLFGAYSGKRLHDMIDAASRLMFTQPEDLQRIINQGRMFIPESLHLGVPMKDIFTELMSMGQTGYLRSRGGSGIARFIEYLMGSENLTSHMSKARRNAMRDFGVYDSSGRLKFEDKHGHLLLEQAIKYLADVSKNMRPGRFLTDAMNAFGAQGGRWLMAITEPHVWAQRQLNVQALNRIAKPGMAVETMWKKYADTFNFAVRQFITNVLNVLAATFYPLLPKLTQGLKSTSNELAKLTSWLFKHPKAAAAIAIAAFAGTFAAATYAARSVWQLNAAISALAIVSGGGGRGRRGRGPILPVAKPSMLNRIGDFGWGALNFLTFGGAGALKFLFSKWNALLPAGIDLITNRLIMPALQAINKLGPLGSRIVGFLLRLQNPMAMLGDVFKALFRSMSGVDLEVIAGGITRLGAALSGLLGIVSRLLGGALAPFLFTQGGLFNPMRTAADNPFWKVDQWLQYMRQHPGAHVDVNGRPTVQVNNPVFHMTSGADPLKHAQEFLDHVMRSARTGAASHGVHNPVHPFFASPALQP